MNVFDPDWRTVTKSGTPPVAAMPSALRSESRQPGQDVDVFLGDGIMHFRCDVLRSTLPRRQLALSSNEAATVRENSSSRSGSVASSPHDFGVGVALTLSDRFPNLRLGLAVGVEPFKLAVRSNPIDAQTLSPSKVLLKDEMVAAGKFSCRRPWRSRMQDTFSIVKQARTGRCVSARIKKAVAESLFGSRPARACRPGAPRRRSAPVRR